MRIAMILQLALGFAALFGYSHLKISSALDGTTRGPQVRAARAEAQLATERVAGEIGDSLLAVRSIVAATAASVAAQGPRRGTDPQAARVRMLASMNAQVGSGASSAWVGPRGQVIVDGKEIKTFLHDERIKAVRDTGDLTQFERTEGGMSLVAYARAADGAVLASALPVSGPLLNQWAAAQSTQVGLGYDNKVFVHTLGKNATWPAGEGELQHQERSYVSVSKSHSGASIVAMAPLSVIPAVSLGEQVGMWILFLGGAAFLLGAAVMLLAPAGAAAGKEENLELGSADIVPSSSPVRAVVAAPLDFSGAAKALPPGTDSFPEHPAPAAAAQDFEASFLKATKPAMATPDANLSYPPLEDSPLPTAPIPSGAAATGPISYGAVQPAATAPIPTGSAPPPPEPTRPLNLTPAAPQPSATPQPSIPAPPVFADNGNSDFDAIANAAVSRPPPVRSEGTDLPAPRGEVPPELRAAHRAEEQRKAHDRLMTTGAPTLGAFGGTVDDDTDLPAPRDTNLPAPRAESGAPLGGAPVPAPPSSIPPRSQPLPGELVPPSTPPAGAPAVALPGSSVPAAAPPPVAVSAAPVALPGSAPAPAPAAAAAVALPGSAAAPAPSPVALPGSAGAPPPAAPSPAGGPMPFDEAHYRVVYNEFVASKARLGEVVENISYDGFRSKLRTSEQHLLNQHGCRAVRFQVLVKDKTVSLRPQLVR